MHLEYVGESIGIGYKEGTPLVLDLNVEFHQRFFNFVCQSIQNKQRVVLQIFLLFLLMKLLSHPFSKYFTEEVKAQEMPKRKNKKCHSSLAFSQWMSTWFIGSSELLHKQHWLANDHCTYQKKKKKNWPTTFLFSYADLS